MYVFDAYSVGHEHTVMIALLLFNNEQFWTLELHAIPFSILALHDRNAISVVCTEFAAIEPAAVLNTNSVLAVIPCTVNVVQLIFGAYT